MQSTVSLINPVFGRSQMMFGANVKSLHIITNVSQVSLTLHLQCVLFPIHIFSNFCCLAEESQQGGIWYLAPFPRGRREEPHLLPDHNVLQARPARLQPQHGHHEQVQGEREATLVSGPYMEFSIIDFFCTLP